MYSFVRGMEFQRRAAGSDGIGQLWLRPTGAAASRPRAIRAANCMQ